MGSGISVIGVGDVGIQLHGVHAMKEVEFRADYTIELASGQEPAVLEALVESIRKTIDDLGVVAVGSCEIWHEDGYSVYEEKED